MSLATLASLLKPTSVTTTIIFIVTVSGASSVVFLACNLLRLLRHRMNRIEEYVGSCKREGDDGLLVLIGKSCMYCYLRYCLIPPFHPKNNNIWKLEKDGYFSRLLQLDKVTKCCRTK
ncbi:uncharacterized protein [Rutidosis leptorrhynchoides]|uniref:uncharacterized protein isoform X1 n=1 Tax=Rutidosis leptorrhynchoides TaxID=125765 RepID=UPI003A9966F5